MFISLTPVLTLEDIEGAPQTDYVKALQRKQRSPQGGSNFNTMYSYLIMHIHKYI